MKNRSLLLALFVALLSLPLVVGGCKSQKDDDSVAEQKKRLPAYFEEIPADTFFFAGGSEPVPRELVDKTLSTANTMWQWSQMLDGQQQSKLDEKPSVVPVMQVVSPEEQAADLFSMLIEEMGGEVSAEGLAELGISPSPRIAAYAVGVVPVARIELSDPAKFAAFVGRLEEKYQISPTLQEYQGESYRQYGDAYDTALLRITDTEAILAAPQNEVVDVFVPYFVGAKKPAQSLAEDNAFLRTVEKHGFERFGAGYVDLEQMVAYFTRTEQPTGVTAEILEAANYEMNGSEACKTEWMRLVRMAPRLVAGFREYDENTTDFAAGAELQDALARGLKQTVDGTPGYNTAFAEKSLLQIGMGINTGKMIDFLVSQAREIQEQPFQCEDFQSLNQEAANLVGVSGQVPPALRALAGFNLLVHNIGLEWQTDTTVFIPRVLAAIRTEQPEAFMFLVSQAFPLASQIKAQPDGQPVAIPQAQGIYEGIIEPSLLMTQRGLAVTVGPNMAESTRTVLDADEAVTAPALVLRLNLGDPAREMTASLKTIIDEADADKEARQLTAEDIAAARRAVATIEDVVPQQPWAATFTGEFSDFGVLFSYRDQGALDFDPDAIPEEGVEEDFDALERVLGGVEAVEVIEEEPAGVMPSQPVQPQQQRLQPQRSEPNQPSESDSNGGANDQTERTPEQ